MNELFTVMGEKLKLGEVQDSVLEYYFWRFDNPIALSEKKTTFIILCTNAGVRELIVDKGVYPTVSDLTFYMMHTVHHNWSKKYEVLKVIYSKNATKISNNHQLFFKLLKYQIKLEDFCDLIRIYVGSLLEFVFTAEQLIYEIL